MCFLCKAGAPDVGAFYFEDAARLLMDRGYDIGDVDVTMPPREKRKLALAGGIPSRDELVAGVSFQKYRVLRCSYRNDAPVCDILVAPAAL